MVEIQTLLTEILSARAKQQDIAKEDPFNVFRLLRRETDEVNLHSRFLAELLNPDGSHKCGNRFLELFLQQCGITSDEFNLDTARTLRESNNIDILLHTNHEAIIIENKIWAGDQNRQLERYATVVDNKRLKYRILYLTLNGHPPTDQSVGKLAKRADFDTLIICISYAQQIQSWLLECIKEAALRPPLRETLVQYLSLVKSLTGNTMSESEKQSVLQLMQSGQNAIGAHILVRNWNHVRWHTEYDFWQDLAGIIEEDGFQIAPERRYSQELISRVVHYQRNRNPWYGISILMPSFDMVGSPIKLMIERSDGVLYYGILATSPDTATRKQAYSIIVAAVRHLHYGKSESWPVVVDSKSHINFESFSHPDTVGLANPVVRKEAVEALWKDVRAFMQQIETALSNQESVVGASEILQEGE